MTLSPLQRWIWSGGWVAIVIPTALVVATAFVVGAARTGEILLGVVSPVRTSADWPETSLSWAVAAIGWLAAPILIGTVVGYVITRRLSSYRSRTRDDILNGPGLEHE